MLVDLRVPAVDELRQYGSGILVVLRLLLALGQLIAQVLRLPLDFLGEPITEGILRLAFQLFEISLPPLPFRSRLEQVGGAALGSYTLVRTSSMASQEL